MNRKLIATARNSDNAKADVIVEENFKVVVGEVGAIVLALCSDLFRVSGGIRRRYC